MHTFVSGCVPGAMSGPHTFDEVKVGLLTGKSSSFYLRSICLAAHKLDMLIGVRSAAAGQTTVSATQVAQWQWGC